MLPSGPSHTEGNVRFVGRGVVLKLLDRSHVSSATQRKLPTDESESCFIFTFVLRRRERKKKKNNNIRINLRRLQKHTMRCAELGVLFGKITSEMPSCLSSPCQLVDLG